jgi:hypothetical protein
MRYSSRETRDLKCILSLFGALVVSADLVACAAEVDRERVAVVQEEIIGGTTTKVGHYEVGQYFDASGSSCTATLINDQWFIMAAHCVGDRAITYGGTCGSGGACYYPGEPGWGPVNVDRVWAFNGNPAQWIASSCGTSPTPGPDCGNVVGSFDVALGRLASPLNIVNLFTPGRIAAIGPQPGDTLTAIGYGCTSRSPQTGGGTKRKITFTYSYPSNTNFTCPGDSGGPVFASNGKIVMLMSGYSSNDIFADIWRYKWRIQEMIRAQSGAVESHIARTGFERYSSSNSYCYGMCSNDSHCQAFTSDSSTGGCWTQGALAEATFTRSDNSVSTVVEGTQVGSGNLFLDFADLGDRPGGDIPNAQISVPPSSPGGTYCAWKCAERNDCASWTFVSSQSLCYLKSTIPALTATATCPANQFNCISGIRRSGEVADRPGNDLVSHKNQTWDQCTALCAGNRDCVAVSYTPNNNTCYEKYAISEPVTQSYTVWSAIKRGFMYDTDLPGNEIGGFDYAPSDPPLPEICQAACYSAPGCYAWTYDPTTSGRTTPHCFFKSNLTTPSYGRIGRVSGPWNSFEELAP